MSCCDCSEPAELLRLREEDGTDSALLTSGTSVCLQTSGHHVMAKACNTCSAINMCLKHS